jgi:hypothetical protein
MGIERFVRDAERSFCCIVEFFLFLELLSKLFDETRQFDEGFERNFKTFQRRAFNETSDKQDSQEFLNE